MNLKKYLLAAVLIIVPLYPKFPFIHIPGTYVSIRLEDFLLLVLGVVTLISIIPKLFKFLSDRITTSFLIFFAVGLVSVIAGAFLTKTVSFSIGMLHLIRRVEYAVPLFAALTLFKRRDEEKNLDFYLKTIFIVILVAFIYGLGQRYLNFPIIDTQNDEYSKGVALFWTVGAHINSTFAGHYDLASYLVLILPIFSTLFFLTDKVKLKIILLVGILSGLWLMGASLSRASLISWVIASSLSLFMIKKYKGIIYILVAAALVVAFFPSFLGRYQRFFQVYAAEATPSPMPVQVNEDRSASIRVNVEWPRAIRSLEKNPLIGTGYSSIGLAADNDYLRALAEVGILGFLGFGLIFLQIGKEFWFYNKHKDRYGMLEKAFVTGIMGGIVGTFITATVIDIFEASKFAIIFWLLVGYAVFVIRNRKNEQEI